MDTYVSTKTLASFACKLILKLAFSEESLKKLVEHLLRHIFSKGYLKKAQNGPLFQGISLNVYMVILTCLVGADGTGSWRQEIHNGMLI